MERKFLENFKVGDQPLTREIIDAIMAENGADIEAAKRPFADYDTVKGQLAAAQETIKGFESQDIDGVRKAAQDWEKKYNQAIADHRKQMDDLAFDGILKDAITAARGKSDKAIRALLDVDALKASRNQANDIKAALEALQRESGYLFGDEQTPPPYSAGAGSSGTSVYNAEDSLRAAMGLSVKK